MSTYRIDGFECSFDDIANAQDSSSQALVLTIQLGGVTFISRTFSKKDKEAAIAFVRKMRSGGDMVLVRQ